MNYDSLGRIIYVFYPDSSSIAYAYDNMGNRVSAKVHDPCTTKPKPVITASGPTVFCAGDSVMLTSSPGSKYLWSNGDTLQTIKALAGGDYTVTRLDAFQCSLTSLPITVSVNPLPVTTIVANASTSLCAGDSVTLTTSITGTGYQWSNNETTQSISVNSTGDYSVSVTDANGCTGSSSEISVTENPLPTPTVNANGGTVICAGDSIALSSSIMGSSYLWSNGFTSQNISASVGGDYSVAVTDANGCTGESSAISVLVNPLPTPTVIAEGATTFCSGGSVVLSSSIIGTDYLWSNGALGDSISANEGGNYSVAVTDANGCTEESVAVTVVENPLPSPAIDTDGGMGFCSGDSVSLSSSIIGAEYLWSNGATSPNIYVTQSGSYFVVITDDNECEGTSSAIDINEYLQPTVDAGNTVTVSDGDATVIGGIPTAAGSGPFTYSWTPANGLDSANVSNPTAMPQITTTYTVVATDANGCSSVDSILVSVELVTGVVRSSRGTGIIVYPNPTNDLLNVSGSEIENGDYLIELKSALGQTILSEKLRVSNKLMQQQFSLHGLSSGTYFLIVESREFRRMMKVKKVN